MGQNSSCSARGVMLWVNFQCRDFLQVPCTTALLRKDWNFQSGKSFEYGFQFPKISTVSLMLKELRVRPGKGCAVHSGTLNSGEGKNNWELLVPEHFECGQTGTGSGIRQDSFCNWMFVCFERNQLRCPNQFLHCASTTWYPPALGLLQFKVTRVYSEGPRS